MKVTQLRDKDKTTALTTMDMETWIEKTRTEIKTQPVSVFREALRYSLPDSRFLPQSSTGQKVGSN